MKDRIINAAEFQASCLEIIDEINRDKQSVTITKHGMPVARISPMEKVRREGSIVGKMKGSVLRYDAPFAPAHLMARDAQG